ncbi:CopM family metallochaperone [Psychrobacter sp. VH5]|uniref:CopM family metallochaperone n=1 Tax=Psychrobacter sp. VH5 TaxID=3423439 RepID=UPI003D652F2C
MNDMHGEMTLGITDPNPDMAFARGMLPHHRGAVDMAEVQLEYGKDPEMLQLAQEIIAAQQPKIEQMQNWIKANGGVGSNAQ